ncbi:hypothetical protein FACS189472_00860 [Alphaproteobacteria bacterium]|nr:hypothetical protein FACS189472_00860 [Alphaproteobacteria bacterium]
MKKILAIAMALQVFDLYGMKEKENISSSSSKPLRGEVNAQDVWEEEDKLTVEGFMEQFSFLPAIIGTETGKYNAELAFMLCKLNALNALDDLDNDDAVVAVMELPFKEWKVTGCLKDQQKARINALKILCEAKTDKTRSIIIEKHHDALDTFLRFKQMEKDLRGFMEERGFDHLPMEMQLFIDAIGLKKLDKKR